MNQQAELSIWCLIIASLRELPIQSFLLAPPSREEILCGKFKSLVGADQSIVSKWPSADENSRTSQAYQQFHETPNLLQGGHESSCREKAIADKSRAP